MGPYSFIPFMECYHGILSMNHKILGSLKYNDENISFNEGKGYMERTGAIHSRKHIYGCKVIIFQSLIFL